MFNRVWIAYTDFTLDQGGSIHVDDKGHGPAQGPGKGIFETTRRRRGTHRTLDQGPQRIFFPDMGQMLNGESNFSSLIETNALPETLSGEFTEVIRLAGGAPRGSSATAGNPGTFRWIAIKPATLLILR